MLHLYNGLILVLIFVGVSLRKDRKIHVPIMITSFVLDMVSVVYLEMNRQVVHEAFTHLSERIMQIHLFFAVGTLLGYAVALYTGRKLLKGATIFWVHRLNAVCFLFCRTGIFVTSFLVH